MHLFLRDHMEPVECWAFCAAGGCMKISVKFESE
jgi:hypothetical protein